MRPSVRYFLAAISSTIIWGFFSIPLRKLQGYAAEDILIYRIFISLLLSLCISLLFRRKSIREDLAFLKSTSSAKRSSIIRLIVFSSLFITGNWFAFIYVVNSVSLQSAAFAYMVCPIITALSGYFILKEPLSKLKWIAILISFVSISILAIRFYHDVLFSVLIAVLYTIYLLMQKKIEGVNKFNVVLVQLVVSTLLILPFYLLHYHAAPLEFNFWFYIFIISMFFTILPLFLNLYALTGLPSSTMGIIIYMNPIMSFFVAFLYFDEKVSLLQLSAYLILLAAIVIFNWNFLMKALSGKQNPAY